MPRQRRYKPADRPQTAETWGVLVTQLRLWITPEDEPPSRPFLVLVLDLDSDRVPYQDMFPQAPPPGGGEWVWVKAMNKPLLGGGKPRRPAIVRFADSALAEALAPA